MSMSMIPAIQILELSSAGLRIFHVDVLVQRNFSLIMVTTYANRILVDVVQGIVLRKWKMGVCVVLVVHMEPHMYPVFGIVDMEMVLFVLQVLSTMNSHENVL